MDNDLPNERMNGSQQGLGDILKESASDALRVLDHTQISTGKARQTILGATLGVSLSFLIALATVQRLDTPLTVATYAVAVAVPFLTGGFVFSLMDFGPGVPVFLRNVLKVANFYIAEGMGSLAAGVAFMMLLWHFSVGAALTALGATLAAFLAPTFVVMAIIFRLVVVGRKAKACGESLSGEELVRRSRLVSMFLEDDKEKHPTTRSSL